MELKKTYRFEAAHTLPKHEGKCSRRHGHSWVLHVFVEGDINPATGFVMDYAEISEIVKPLIERLDHRDLGQWGSEYNTYEFKKFGVPGMPADFYPSSENLLYWIGQELRMFPWSKLAIEETCTSYCELTREEFELKKRIK